MSTTEIGGPSCVVRPVRPCQLEIAYLIAPNCIAIVGHSNGAHHTDRIGIYMRIRTPQMALQHVLTLYGHVNKLVIVRAVRVCTTSVRSVRSGRERERAIVAVGKVLLVVCEHMCVYVGVN